LKNISHIEQAFPNLTSATMKTIILFCITSVFTITQLRAQNSSTATAQISATIVSPVGTTKVNDLDFGSFTSNEKGGQITLITTEQNSYPHSLKFKGSAAMMPATFRVSSTSVYDVSVSDTDLALSNKSGTAEMRYQPVVTATTNSGQDCIMIGGVLNYAAKQQPGLYTSNAPLAVTIYFN
jgi:hypothetical protein